MASTLKKKRSEDSLMSNTNPRKRRRDNSVQDSTLSLPVYDYHDDSDFDEAFRNLLRPVEIIAKSNPYDYNLLKELDSYLTYLKRLQREEYINFIEAAMMLQNVMLIYQKRVDLVVDFMMKLIGKFRAYRVHQNNGYNGDIEAEHVECNKKRRNEKRIKYYTSFEPIKEQVFGILRNYDCKIINLKKLPCIPKLVANANIKVNNKLNEILPYIPVKNSENIGKKYNYSLNNHLSRDLVANFEYDCHNIDKTENIIPLNSLSINQIDRDSIAPNEHLPPEHHRGTVLSDETIHEFFVPNAITTTNSQNVLNVSQIPENNIDAWITVHDSKSDIYLDRPISKKKKLKELKNNNGVWLPTYVVSELFMEMFKLKTGLGVDPAFRKLVVDAQNRQKSDISKKNFQHKKESDDLIVENNNEDFDEKLLNGGGFGGFDDVIYHEGIFFNIEPEVERLEVIENFQTYKKNVEDMKKHEQNQIDLMDEQLKMCNRVQAWHEILWPILENEERKTPFNVHDYGTKILNCFNSKGEKKSFEQLVSGLKQEEVARYFLSTLMLANTYNLHITKQTHDPLNIGIMDIELLKKERHHEELQNSVQTNFSY
ncbi:uncharacterized protein LOC126898363 isoform X1 [Daktulosphaira vitifoliae]|uniref:uncharacterized protein LOC126898363 isoform X1 n=1 Tax=Daktulosphaira vitifoliae TaxID=58002 RepID=UPI0021A97FE0|nr:uncharacterized protein LOC126898363 isoform X1 [Daktulosphaira vitifoliae]XP_050528286.1 uncharacterized protein LOC126898363 isoform X2 [Daktulosphaira vitifoliae]XP_050528287.1 uncharacterized protein LOC126898363 isoform X1 [Daktulosphaira vitifoliae]XP_050528288.1 uncharacterized protein LOC126898363 isoform X1 [Daktulosphaira vitifoliae]